MTSLTAYVALATHPAVSFLMPEPVSFCWAYRHGRMGSRIPPMPPELRQRSERNSRYLSLVQDALLMAFVFYWMRRYSLPPTSIGLRLDRLGISVSAGVAGGLSMLGWGALVRRAVGAVVGRAVGRGALQSQELSAHGRDWIRALRLFSGVFAEELWRALSIVCLEQTGHSVLSAVIISSIVFGVGHLQTGPRLAGKLGLISGVGTGGAVFALLFVFSRSLVTPCAAHLVVNSVRLYATRSRPPSSGAPAMNPGAGVGART